MFLLSLLVLCHAQAAGARDLEVVVTTKPVHSLVAAVMAGAGTPKLLVDGRSSPHSFQLKPSGAKAINGADVFIRVAETVEPFTQRITGTLPATVTLVTLAETPGLTLLDIRQGATFEPHAHGTEAKHDHDHGHAAGGTHAAGEHDEDDDHGAKDGHVWLDPENAKVMAGRIAAVLSLKSPAQAAIFAANAAALKARIDGLTSEIAVQTKPVAAVPFIVFHDAYQYFENRFGLSAAGSVTVSPDVQPSAKRITALRAKIATLGATCVFAEPLFNEKLVAAVTEGGSARAGTLDPEGLMLEPGPELYFTLMRTLAANLTACLKPAA
jgi:zinc transport system substrate-binding protein